MILWSIVQTLMGLVKTYHQLVALRLLLGLFECALFPSISLFLGSWYKRKEQSLRIALFFSAATLAGAFGGILGWAIAHMKGVGGMNGWSWIVRPRFSFSLARSRVEHLTFGMAL